MAAIDGVANAGGQHSQASGTRNEMLALPSLAGFGMGGSVSGCTEWRADESKLVLSRYKKRHPTQAGSLQIAGETGHCVYISNIA